MGMPVAFSIFLFGKMEKYSLSTMDEILGKKTAMNYIFHVQNLCELYQCYLIMSTSFYLIHPWLVELSLFYSPTKQEIKR